MTELIDHLRDNVNRLESQIILTNCERDLYKKENEDLREKLKAMEQQQNKKQAKNDKKQAKNIKKFHKHRIKVLIKIQNRGILW